MVILASQALEVHYPESDGNTISNHIVQLYGLLFFR